MLYSFESADSGDCRWRRRSGERFEATNCFENSHSPCAVKRNATGRAGVQSSVTPPAKQESPCAFKRNEIEQKPVVELTFVCCCCLASVSLSNVYIYTHARTHARTHTRTHTRTHARTHTHTHTQSGVMFHLCIDIDPCRGLICPKYNDGTIVEREGYRVRGNRRAVYLGCGEKTAKTKGVVRSAAI